MPGNVQSTTAAATREVLRGEQEALFQKMIRLCFLGHPYYRQLFSEIGLRPADVQGLDDLSRLPLTQKASLMAEPEQFRLRLDLVSDVSVEERTLRDIIYTTGSTSAPTPFYDTTHDHFSRIYQMKKAVEIAGVSPDDVIMNLFPLTSIPHQGFLSAQWGASAIGARLVAGLTGRSYPDFPIHNSIDRAIDLIAERRATILWGIATYVRRLVMRAQERGGDFSSVRLVFAMGESCPSGMRDDMRARLATLGAPAVRILSGYGFTEMQGPTIECAELSGFHIPTPTQYYFEILDPETHQPVPDGAEGLVVITHLNRRGTVLLRYVVGDISAIVYDPCPHCGRTEPRFSTSPYRTSGLIKVKGTLVNPAAIHEAMTQLQSSGLVEYQVAVVKDDPDDLYSPDTLLVRLACEPLHQPRLAAETISRIRRVAELTPRLALFPADGFVEQVQQYKFKRFVDER